MACHFTRLRGSICCIPLTNMTPSPWREFTDTVGRSTIGDAGEYVTQPDFGLDDVEPGGLDQRVGRRCPVTAFVGAGEEVARSP